MGTRLLGRVNGCSPPQTESTRSRHRQLLSMALGAHRTSSSPSPGHVTLTPVLNNLDAFTRNMRSFPSALCDAGPKVSRTAVRLGLPRRQESLRPIRSVARRCAILNDDLGHHSHSTHRKGFSEQARRLLLELKVFSEIIYTRLGKRHPYFYLPDWAAPLNKGHTKHALFHSPNPLRSCIHRRK